MVEYSTIRKDFTKYTIILIVYFLISGFFHSFIFKLYFNFVENPELTPYNLNMIQTIISGISAFFGLGVAIFMIIDIKKKKILEWLIIIITIFYPAIGIVLFILNRVLYEKFLFRIDNESS